MKVHFQLGRDDVATYILHPRSGPRRIDRLNEAPTAGERRMVDELDPNHRPLYILTPSSKVVRDLHGGAPVLVVRTDESAARLPSIVHPD